MEKNHNDPWLADFVRSPLSFEANELLQSAVHNNFIGQNEFAFQQATSAQKKFSQIGNLAGALRSELEALYALRRHALGDKCQEYYRSSASLNRQTKYLWLQIRISVEISGCTAMTNDFDHAWHIAQKAVESAGQARYPSLQLRALGYLASFHTIEGRLRQSWQANEAGLAIFWNSIFSRDRAYQFYSDLEFVAEKAEQWHLAAILQREALEQFRDSKRLDFRASAHCRLGRMEQMIGNPGKAETEFRISQQLFHDLSQNNPNREPAKISISQTDCEISWGSLEARYGTVDSAIFHLGTASDPVERTDSFAIQLRYEKAWAIVEKRLGNRDEETKHLHQAIAIGNKGFKTLQSPMDRWNWRHEVGEAYRELLELEIEHSREPTQAFTDWESFRSFEMPDSFLLNDPFVKSDDAKKIIMSRLKELHQGTILGFTIFPNWVTAWLADDRGIKTFRISIDSKTLKSQVFAFYRLCSMPDTSIEKVKDLGSRFYELLIGPLEQFLEPNRTLFIEADQFLSLLAWPALVRRDGTYLGQSYVMVNTPGLFYQSARKGGDRVMEQALIAYPGAVKIEDQLFAASSKAREEADYVASLYPHHKYLRESEVAAEQLLDHLPKASLFHFSGHAITREYNGELIIQGASTGDVFSASRLAGIDMSGTRLVVLSACSTGGASEPTQDPNGLVRAFLNAGAGRVIASQWDVSSAETSVLMKAFYQSLSVESNPEKALKNAWQRFISSNSDLSHPYNWASFQVFGAVN